MRLYPPPALPCVVPAAVEWEEEDDVPLSFLLLALYILNGCNKSHHAGPFTCY